MQLFEQKIHENYKLIIYMTAILHKPLFYGSLQHPLNQKSFKI